MLTNDSVILAPQTLHHGRRLEFDFPGLRIGVADYAEGPTGCTVFHFPKGAATAVDVRGGSGAYSGNFEWNHAICFAGGSVLGLEAAAGVAAELFALRGHSTKFWELPLVSGAVIYDYAGRDNAVYPDQRLGRAALRAAHDGVFPFGRRGAGCSARVGRGFDFSYAGEPSGQGGAFRQVGPTRIAVFTVVNAIGAIVDRHGNVVRGHLDPLGGTRAHAIADIETRLVNAGAGSVPSGNTTLTLLVTNQLLDRRALTHWGRQVHASMARAIQPFHTIEDGDVLYAVTTGEVENRALNTLALGTLASEVAWEAVLSAFT